MNSSIEFNIIEETLGSYNGLVCGKIESSIPSYIESISINKVLNRAMICAALAACLSAGVPQSHNSDNDPFLYPVIEHSLSLPDGVSMGRNWINGIHIWQDVIDIDQVKPFLSMYKVSSKIEELLSNGKYAFIDNALNSFDVNVTSVGLLVSILSTTSFAKSHLPSRALFFQRVKTRIVARGEDKPGLLDGLA